MSETFLHGVEVVQVNDGIRPIRTVRSSVIGVVGTAPNSAPEVKASLTAGAVSANNAITYTAKAYGAAGNAVSVFHKDPQANSSALAVTVSGKAITVSLATNSSGVITTTASQCLSAVAASAAAAALVSAANYDTSNGSGVMTADYRAAYLAGGSDEPFPLNTPVLVPGDQYQAAALGTAGTLPAAMTGIFKQTGAVVIVVRVAEGADETATIQNVIGGVNSSTGQYEGAWAFLGAESGTGFCPKILIAPGWTHQYGVNITSKNAVMAEFESIAERLRAVVIGDGPNTNDADAVKARRLFGSKRVYLHDPFYKVMQDGDIVHVPASAYIAGLIAKVDNDEGFWVSPSNHEILGITGTSRGIDFTLGDSNCRANLLNERDVSVTIRQDGFKLWGNRTCSSDQNWAFLSVVRTADMINESLLRAHLWAVDRGITRTYYEDVVNGVKAYLSRLEVQGAIIGGTAWADKAFNKPEDIQAGRATFSFDFTPPFPAERVTFRSQMVNNYLTEIL